jgi:flagellar basal body-associated protein FliL
MAEKQEKKAEAPPAAEKGAAEKPAAKAGGGIGALLGKTPVLLGVVMIIEAVVLIVGLKVLGGSAPKTAVGADLVTDNKSADGTSTPGATTQNSNQPAEIQLVDFKALNKLSGHSFLYDVSIFVTVKPDFQDRVTDAIKANQALIEDRVRTIIAELDPEKLGGGAEPGLETLRRQVKFQLDEILGDGMVDEVLVPRCIPFRTDY